MERRREDANKRFRGEYVHTIPNPNEQPTEPDQPARASLAEAQQKDAETQHRKGPKKQQRSVSKGGGKKPNTGYRPGRRV